MDEDRVPKVNIILVEESSLQAKKDGTLLEKLGHKVAWIQKGSDAILQLEEQFKKSEREHITLSNAFSNYLIMTDCLLPDMDGSILVSTIKNHPNSKIRTLPILMMISPGIEENILQASSLFADDYINKPFRFEELKLRVSSVLQKYENKVKVELYQRIFDKSQKGVSLIDKNGNYLLTNNSYRQLFNDQTPDISIPKNWKFHFPTKDHLKLNKLILRVLEKGVFKDNFESIDSDEQKISFELSLTKLSPLEFLAETHNISSEVRKEEAFLKFFEVTNQRGVIFNEHGLCLYQFTADKQDKNIYLWQYLNIEDAEKIEIIKKWIETLFAKKIPFKDIVKMGPRNLNRKGIDYGLELFPIEGKVGQIESILLYEKLIIEEKVKETESDSKTEQSEMFMTILKNRHPFSMYVSEVKIYFEDILKTVDSILDSLKIENQQNISDERIKNIKRSLHSIKGGAGIYLITNVQRMTHSLESEVEKFLKVGMNAVQFWSIFRLEMGTIIEVFNRLLKELKVLLGDSFLDGETSLEVPFVKSKKFLTELSSALPENKRSLLNDFTDIFLRSSIGNYFQGYNFVLLKEAKKKGKKIDNIVYQGLELKVDSSYYKKLFLILEHIFLNIIDHGIETPEERKLKKKTPQGRVLVSFAKATYQNNLSLNITIQDDGGGIDSDRIRKKLVELNYPPDQIESDDKLVIQHIFDESFSTAKEITMTSGRGIGLSAVKKEVERLGGAIVVHSVKDKGTKFVIIVPYY